MPRLKPIPLTRRNQLDQRMTFDSTTPDIDAIARPVDAIERKDVSSKASSLAQALGLFGDSLNNIGQMQQQIMAHDNKEGEFMALKGEDKPTKGQALIQGYEKAQGRLAASKYQQEMNEFFLNNHEALSPEEFQEGLTAISNKYLEASPSDDYLKGFLPQAQSIEDKTTLAYQEVVAENLRKENIETISQTMNNEVMAYLGETLGIDSIETLEEIKKEPEEYQRLIGKTEVDSVSEGVRNQLTDFQEIAKGMNIDRTTTSTLLVHQLGNLAVEYGLPNLLDFANIPDESKVALKNNPDLMNVIESYKDQAENEQNRIVEMQDREATKQTVEDQKLFVNQTTFKITDLELMQNDPEGGLEKASAEAKKLLEELREKDSYKTLDDNRVRMIEGNLQKIIDGDKVFRSQSVKPVFEDLLDKARAGEITDEDVLTNSGNLSQNHYSMFLNFIDERAAAEEQAQLDAQAAAQAKAEKAIKDRNKDIDRTRNVFFQDTLDTTIDYVTSTIGFVDERFSSAITKYMNNKYIEYIYQNDFRPPSLADTEQWFNNYLGSYEGSPVKNLEQITSSGLVGVTEESQTTEGQLNYNEGLADGTIEPKEPEDNRTIYEKIFGGDKEVNVDPYNTEDTYVSKTRNNPYASTDRLLREQEEKAQAEANAPRKPFSLPREKVFGGFDSFKEQGYSIREIANDGVRQGVFTEEEASLYAKTYAIENVQDIFRTKGALGLDEALKTLQEEGFTYLESLELAKEARAIVVPDSTGEEEEEEK